MSLRQDLVVDAVDDRRVHPVGRGGDQHFAGAGRQQRRALVLAGEMSGAFHGHVDALVGHLGRIPFGGDLHRAPDLAVVADGDRCRPTPRPGRGSGHARCRRRKRCALASTLPRSLIATGTTSSRPLSTMRAQHEAPDAPKSVDRDLDGHLFQFPYIWLQTIPDASVPQRLTASGVMPKCLYRSSNGAEAPKPVMPMKTPSGPEPLLPTEARRRPRSRPAARRPAPASR